MITPEHEAEMRLYEVNDLLNNKIITAEEAFTLHLLVALDLYHKNTGLHFTYDILLKELEVKQNAD